MSEFINSIGKTNLIIIISIVVVILFALVITIIVERLSNKKKDNEIEIYEEPEVEIQEEVALQPEIKEKPVFEEGIVYEEEKTESDAKKELEEATKKLIEEEINDLEGPTFFEKEQEENSIISYDELVKASQNIDETNDLLLADEGSEPITIEELYKKHNDEENKDFDNPEFIFDENKVTYEEGKRFKNSDVISPVFGIYENKSKLNMPVKQEEPVEIEEVEAQENNNLDRTIDLEDLEQEIRKTEEFLKELKSLKNKLD